MAPRVFWPAALVVTAFTVYAIVFRDAAARQAKAVQDHVIGDFGWYYIVLVTLFVVFAIRLGLGRFGGITLGDDGERAEYSLSAWLPMLFAAGMGIGLVFWGVAEPLFHYEDPRPGVGSTPAQRADAAMVQTFLHWGIHPWAIYVVVGLAIAYSNHRKGRPVSIRWSLESLVGDRIRGWRGDVIDVVAVIGTVFGVATSLGLGVLQISAGLNYQGWLHEPGKGLQVVLVVAVTALATISVAVDKGIKLLSQANMGVAAVLLVYVLIAGPTLFIVDALVQNLGQYLQTLPRISLYTGASEGPDGTAWTRQWTVFYWGWWISWAPFVGVFIARISRGRTVREFVAGVLLVPTLLTFVWFAVFGGAGLHREMFGGGGLSGADGPDRDSALFALLHTLPGGSVTAGLAILVIVLFFVTSADSGALVVNMLSSGGNPEPPRWSRAFWTCAQGAVAVALLVASGTGATALTTLQTVAILIALPFSVVMLAMSVALVRTFRLEAP
ncbi:BCCT family transporter [Nocardia yunnanensis]|uniref:BCCT family transporter n=1 Tax=Nocardia yunnanensis TaxID=2382165 RepID=A0A386ZKF7_9NOCA|nr:BCCT family transporter [Nocardia yunnanensis]